jgi:hypothetical protein
MLVKADNLARVIPRSRMAALCVLLLTITACARIEGSPTAADIAPKPTNAIFGSFYGECGSVTDEEVTQITAIEDLRVHGKNGIKCRWETGVQYVMFNWYRGSPIDRERTGSERLGRDVDNFEFEGRRAYTSRNAAPGTCEIGVEDHADFIYWVISYRSGPQPVDVCAPARELAKLTIARSK